MDKKGISFFMVTNIGICSKSRMISPIDSPRGQSGFFRDLCNISILATLALFVVKFSPYTLKIMQITIVFKLLSNLIPILKKVPPNLNKGFIEPPYICHTWTDNQPTRQIGRPPTKSCLRECSEIPWGLGKMLREPKTFCDTRRGGTKTFSVIKGVSKKFS